MSDVYEKSIKRISMGFQTEVISHCMLHVAEALSANNIVTVLHLMLPCWYSKTGMLSGKRKS